MQPNVVMLTTDLQIDRRILLQADSLEANGWKVTILAPQTGALTAPDDPRVVRPDAGSASVTSLPFLYQIYYRIKTVLPMDNALIRSLKRFLWKFWVDQEVFFSSLLDDLAAQYCPAIFVAHDLPMLPLAYKHSVRCGAKLVYDSHEFFCEQEFSVHEQKRWREIELSYIDKCDAVITVNASIAAELEKRYGLPEVFVIQNADRIRSLPVISRIFHEFFSLSDKTHVLLLQGGLSAGRNLETLIEGLAHSTNDQIALVVLGDGPIKESLTASVSRLGLESRVFFHPAVPQDDLPRFTAAADAGVIPYQATCLNNYYCTPNKMFEFIAAGLPILASDLPEISRMVAGNNLGLAGNMDNAATVGQMIDDFFSNEIRFKEWQVNVLKARKEICWEVEEKKLLAIYEALKVPE
jgi:glycosyltransferase involved in cell wall biosynthesis